jgi:hypothetical protein
MFRKLIQKIKRLFLTSGAEKVIIDTRDRGNASRKNTRRTKMASKFEGEIMEAMEAIAPMNFIKATILGEAFEVKPKALVAAAKRAGIEYTVKPRVSKTGGAIVTKEDLVKVIATTLEFEAGEIDGLLKATKTDLLKVAEAVTALL